MGAGASLAVAVREHLTPEQVANLLTGAPAPLDGPPAPPPPRKDFRPRYASCDRCGDIRPGVLTFHGDHDWEPELPPEGPVRDLVRVLREHLNKRTILLCSRCVDTVRATTPAVPTTVQSQFGDW